MPTALTLDRLRRYAIARSLFEPTTLRRAITELGFVQLDPIRAPARAQDLMLRLRVADYRAGELEASYPRLAVEEDVFIKYGILPRATQRLMHPRTARADWPRSRWAQAEAVLAFVQDRGVVHPREVDDAFQHGTTKNWFGGNGRASTQLLDGMHYRGLLRVARREGGVRLYAPQLAHERDVPADPDAHLDALIDVAVGTYAPLTAAMLSRLVMWVGSAAAPQWRDRRGLRARVAAGVPASRPRDPWAEPRDRRPDRTRTTRLRSRLGARRRRPGGRLLRRASGRRRPARPGVARHRGGRNVEARASLPADGRRGASAGAPTPADARSDAARASPTPAARVDAGLAVLLGEG